MFWLLQLLRRFITLVVLLALVYLIVSGVQVVTASQVPTVASKIPPASAIVVVGVPAKGTQLAVPSDRLRWGATLYLHHLAPKVVIPISGASSPDVARLEKWGVPHGAIAEVVATSPDEQFAAVSEDLKLTRVIVVTDALDTLWTEGLASGHRLQVEMSAPPKSKKSIFSEVDQLWRESSGVAVGRVLGFGSASWAGD